MKNPTIAIVGVGLMGGSLGLAWRQAHVGRVIGVARSEETLAEALQLGAIDEGTTDLLSAVSVADVSVFCVPVMQIVPLALKAAHSAQPGALFTDVGSTKQAICSQLWKHLPPYITFIGGHPMAGSERVGINAADMYLYENAVYCLSAPPGMPTEHTAMQQMLALVSATGAHPLILDPQAHDLIVAAISHLPHLCAVALVNTVAAAEASGVSILPLAAGGFRDTTRVASGSAEIWRDICLCNKQSIVEMLDAYMSALQQLRVAVEQGDEQALLALFKQAQAIRQSIPTKRRGLLGATHEVTLHLADKPGSIHAVSGLLANAGINIVDIEILRVREGEGGSARLAFNHRTAAETAVQLLNDHGYTARHL